MKQEKRGKQIFIQRSNIGPCKSYHHFFEIKKMITFNTNKICPCKNNFFQETTMLTGM